MKLVVIPMMLLSGCSLIHTKLVAVKVPIVCTQQTVEPIQMEEVTWQLGRNEEGDNLLGLDGENYSNLAVNIGRVTEQLAERREYGEYLQDCIIRFNRDAL